MPFLATAVLLLAVVVLVQLWVTLNQSRVLVQLQAAIGRLEARLAEIPAPPAAMGMHPVGLPVGEFDATTLDGETLTRDDLSGWTLVAAVSPDCPPCQERLPELLSAAAVVPGGRDQVLVVVVDDGTVPPALAAQLQEVARVVPARAESSVFGALGLQYVPTFQWVSPDRVVEFAGPSVDLAVVADLLAAQVEASA